MGVYSIYRLFKHPELILIILIAGMVAASIERGWLQIIVFIILIIAGTVVAEYIKAKRKNRNN